MADQTTKPDPFRDEVRQDSSKLWFLMGTYWLHIVVFIVFVVLLGWALGGAKIISMGIEREAVTNSRPYVETTRSKLLGLNSDVLRLDVEIAESDDEEVKAAKQSQRLAIIAMMREEASRIPSSEVPAAVKKTLDATS
jgi:hypothetical protein